MSSNENNGILKPIDSLIEYIRDIKPYHTKFLEIVEKYNFSEEMFVKIEENLKTEIHLVNDALCKPVGFGLEWDGECGFDPLTCCDLFECIGGYGLIFDNSDLLVSIDIDSIDSTLGTVTIDGDQRFDTKLAIKSIPSSNKIVVDGDQTSYFNSHKLFLISPVKTYNIIEITSSTITIEGNHVEQLNLNPEFSITADRYNTGTHNLTEAVLDSGNTVITVSGSLTPSVADLGVVQSAYNCKNQGAYQVLSTSFDGVSTTVTLINDTLLDFTDATESGKHGSIQLRTGLLAPRRVYLNGNSVDNDRDYRITSTIFNSALNKTTLTLVGTLDGTSDTGTVDLIGYMFGGGFDGYEECSVPKPQNIHAAFSEFLDIEVTAINVPSPTPTVTPTVTPTITVTPSVTVTPTVTPTITITPSVTVTVTPSVTVTPTITVTPSVTVTPTVTVTPSVTVTPTVTVTPSTSIPAPVEGAFLNLNENYQDASSVTLNLNEDI